MNPRQGLWCFAGLAVVVFVVAMWAITSGVMDIAAAASVPIVLCAEGIVFSMLYATIFFGSHEEHTPAADHAKKVERLEEAFRSAHQRV